MYKLSFLIYFLQILNALFIYYYGNFYLSNEHWSEFSSIQYSALILVTISWIGTDLSGIRIISDSEDNLRGSNFISIMLLRNFVFISAFLILSPILYGSVSPIIFIYGFGLLNIPIFYFFGNTNAFNIYLLSEFIQKFFISFLVLFSNELGLNFKEVLSYISLIIILNAALLIIYVMKIEKFYYLEIKNNLLNAKENYLRSGAFYIILQVTQQLTYTLPIIIFQRLGFYNISAELTNMERIMRILRGMAGQAIKVLLGRNSDYSKDYLLLKRLLFILFFSIIILFLFADRFEPLEEFLNFSIEYFSIYLFILPIAYMSTFLLGSKHRHGNFSSKSIIFVFLRLLICIISCIFVVTNIGTIISVIIFCILMEISLLYFLKFLKK